MQRGPRVWERSPLRWWAAAKPCTYKRKLAEAGIVWWADVTHEEEKRWLTWAEAKGRYPELGMETDKREYTRLIG
jgi:hypothetical protein